VNGGNRRVAPRGGKGDVEPAIIDRDIERFHVRPTVGRHGVDIEVRQDCDPFQAHVENAPAGTVECRLREVQVHLIETIGYVELVAGQAVALVLVEGVVVAALDFLGGGRHVLAVEIAPAADGIGLVRRPSVPGRIEVAGSPAVDAQFVNRPRSRPADTFRNLIRPLRGPGAGNPPTRHPRGAKKHQNREGKPAQSRHSGFTRATVPAVDVCRRTHFPGKQIDVRHYFRCTPPTTPRSSVQDDRPTAAPGRSCPACRS